MFAKSIRPSAKREVQKERSAMRMRMWPLNGQIFLTLFHNHILVPDFKKNVQTFKMYC